MRLWSWGVLLLVLGGCAAKAKPPVAKPASAPPPAAPSEFPPVSVWASIPVQTEWPVRATAREELPREDPSRLVRDLADAKACVAVRTELARFVASRLDRVPQLLSPKSLASVRSGLERSAVPGCSIARRDCGDDGRSRRWCWSEAVMDSSTVLALARRELARVDSTRADRIVLEVFRARP